MAITGAKRDVKRRVFTIELDSGDALKKVNVPNGTRRILLEGTIGSLKKARFLEGAILELVGTEGVLRVDLSRKDMMPGRPRFDAGSKRLVTAESGEKRPSSDLGGPRNGAREWP